MTTRKCRTCSGELPTLARSDAFYCSTKCRVFAHRNPFPKEMVAMTRWIRYSKSKIPLTPDDDIAKSNDPRTWSDFGWVKDSKAGVGIGFVFHADGIFGIDLDNAFDDEGNLKEWASKLIEQMPATFIEVSPSGKGLHIIGKGTVGQGRKIAFDDGAIEVYDRGRYFTMTGKPFAKSFLKLSKIDSSSVIEFAESL